MYKKYIKRNLDFILALIAMPFVLLIILIMSPIIYFNDKGPVFYNAERLGQNGRVFKMYKFRSMKVNAPDIRLADGSTYNSADDIRVTSIGKIMRKLSIDEIPQIINVFIGNMSFVGPRPNLPPDDFNKLDQKSKKRVKVKPGITGYSQAYFRNAITQSEKINNDCYYVEHLSFSFDVKIFFQTIKAVIKNKNIYVSTNVDIEISTSKNEDNKIKIK